MNLQLVVENLSTLFTGRKYVPFYILVFNVSVENVSVKMCLSKILHITEYTLGKIFQTLKKALKCENFAKPGHNALCVTLPMCQCCFKFTDNFAYKFRV